MEYEDLDIHECECGYLTTNNCIIPCPVCNRPSPWMVRRTADAAFLAFLGAVISIAMLVFLALGASITIIAITAALNAVCFFLLATVQFERGKIVWSLIDFAASALYVFLFCFLVFR